MTSGLGRAIGVAFLTAACIITILAGCNAIAEKVEAEALARDLFEAVKTKNYDKALTFYSVKFFEKGSREDWRQTLHNVNRKLGDLQSYELAKWDIQKRIGVWESGTRYQLQYNVTYSKYPATEMVVVVKPLLVGDMRIVGHYINSVGLAQR